MNRTQVKSNSVIGRIAVVSSRMMQLLVSIRQVGNNSNLQLLVWLIFYQLLYCVATF